MIQEIDNHIGRGGSIQDFNHYNDCGALIIDVDENRIDEAKALEEQAKTMCKVHSERDPQRDVRVETHRLFQNCRKQYKYGRCQLRS